MTSPFSRIPSTLLGGAAALLCLGVLGCGVGEQARPAGGGASLLTTLPHGCPDGSDLHVRFADVDGGLVASATCGDPESMRPDREPGRQGLPDADRMRPDREPGRQGLPDADR